MDTDKARPALSFSTILSLWRPDFAKLIISEVEKTSIEAKPNIVKRIKLHPSCTEAEKYTADLIFQVCLHAYGSKSLANETPRRKQIRFANVKWISAHIKCGKGITTEELRGVVDLYTNHAFQDNPS